MFKHIAVAIFLAAHWQRYLVEVEPQYMPRDNVTARRLWLGHAFRDMGQGTTL